MLNRKLKYWFLVMPFLTVAILVQAQNDSLEVDFNGQVQAWTTLQFEKPFVIQPGARFVPTLLGKYNVGTKTTFDAEASLALDGNVTVENWKKTDASVDFKPYRIWARYASDKFEVRAGLQKINFGQAKMFRPLMWFDGMDVRDPLQLTDGVTGILAKYFFENNANLWAWGLIGNDKRKGWEMFATEKWKPEVGGRVELPVLKGEIAISTHYRKISAYNVVSSYWPTTTLLNENKIGLDGKWDIGAGVWFESSTTISQKNNILVPRFQDMWNVGVDYTFPLGNGLGVTLEYLRYHAGDEFVVSGNSMHLVGSMLNYPLSLTDNVSLLFFYVPGQNSLFNYASWTRTYDNWSIYAIGFWNPTNASMLSFQANSKNIFAGKGMQLMLSYNF